MSRSQYTTRWPSIEAGEQGEEEEEAAAAVDEVVASLMMRMSWC